MESVSNTGVPIVVWEGRNLFVDGMEIARVWTSSKSRELRAWATAISRSLHPKHQNCVDVLRTIRHIADASHYFKCALGVTRLIEALVELLRLSTGTPPGGNGDANGSVFVLAADALTALTEFSSYTFDTKKNIDDARREALRLDAVDVLMRAFETRGDSHQALWDAACRCARALLAPIHLDCVEVVQGGEAVMKTVLMRLHIGVSMDHLRLAVAMLNQGYSASLATLYHAATAWDDDDRLWASVGNLSYFGRNAKVARIVGEALMRCVMPGHGTGDKIDGDADDGDNIIDDYKPADRESPVMDAVFRDHSETDRRGSMRSYSPFARTIARMEYTAGHGVPGTIREEAERVVQALQQRSDKHDGPQT
jgi:hypothetical protein